VLSEFTFQYFDIPPLICLVVGIVFAVYFSKLNRPEKLLAIVIVLNIIADTTVYILMICDMKSTYIYNFFLPVERILSIVVYGAVVQKGRWEKRIFTTGMIVIFGVYMIGFIEHGLASDFLTNTNTITALIFAVLSYIFLRAVSTGHAQGSVLVIAFGIANLLYSWVTVSALSAIPLALKIDQKVARNLVDINLIGYSLWSCILIFALRWKLKKNL